MFKYDPILNENGVVSVSIILVFGFFFWFLLDEVPFRSYGKFESIELQAGAYVVELLLNTETIHFNC